jgi:hypothetical protein
MTCRYCRKPEDECALDHDEDVFDDETGRRRLHVRRPVAFSYGPSPRMEERHEDDR